MQSILAFQTHKRKFFINRTKSNLKSILPKSAAKEVEDLGELEVKTGKLNVRPGIRKILASHNAWTDFNKRLHEDSYKQVYHKNSNKLGK